MEKLNEADIALVGELIDGILDADRARGIQDAIAKSNPLQREYAMLKTVDRLAREVVADDKFERAGAGLPPDFGMRDAWALYSADQRIPQQRHDTPQPYALPQQQAAPTTPRRPLLEVVSAWLRGHFAGLAMATSLACTAMVAVLVVQLQGMHDDQRQWLASNDLALIRSERQVTRAMISEGGGSVMLTAQVEAALGKDAEPNVTGNVPLADQDALISALRRQKDLGPFVLRWRPGSGLVDVAIVTPNYLVAVALYDRLTKQFPRFTGAPPSEAARSI